MPDGFLASTVVWGWNHKILEDSDTHSLLLESLWQFKHINYLTGRLEIVDKDELFGHGDENDHEHDDLSEVFNVKALTFGYARDFHFVPGYQTGIGANVTFYSIPDELKPFYGDSPKGMLFYFRIRGGSHGSH